MKTIWVATSFPVQWVKVQDAFPGYRFKRVKPSKASLCNKNYIFSKIDFFCLLHTDPSLPKANQQDSRRFRKTLV